ncbi:MAG: NlpC/P60 family protein [Pseudomonadota bacterium]
MQINKIRSANRVSQFTLLLLLGLQLFFTGCSTKSAPPGIEALDPHGSEKIGRLGYTIQVGAFGDVENAAGLSNVLNRKGLSAYYFRHESGLYKVRFGDFLSLDQARDKAESLLQAGVIADYYIVRPESYAIARLGWNGDAYVREKLISTASNFVGIPYKWGGESMEEGFDCSGLVMAVYQLNGLNLPRTSRKQYRTGKAVRAHELKKGDLVFFATNGGRRVSHVGIYTGNNTFIHAPKKGKPIQTASLDNDYFKKRYLGGRTYLGDS